MHKFWEWHKQLENAFNQVHAFEILEQPEIINSELGEEELPETEMSNDQFQRAQQAMKIDQIQLFIFIIESIKNQLNGDIKWQKIFVTGQEQAPEKLSSLIYWKTKLTVAMQN